MRDTVCRTLLSHWSRRGVVPFYSAPLPQRLADAFNGVRSSVRRGPLRARTTTKGASTRNPSQPTHLREGQVRATPFLRGRAGCYNNHMVHIAELVRGYWLSPAVPQGVRSQVEDLCMVLED